MRDLRLFMLLALVLAFASSARADEWKGAPLKPGVMTEYRFVLGDSTGYSSPQEVRGCGAGTIGFEAGNGGQAIVHGCTTDTTTANCQAITTVTADQLGTPVVFGVPFVRVERTVAPSGSSQATVFLYCSASANSGGGGGAGSTTVGSTGGITSPQDWKFGVEAQLRTFIDDTLSLTYEYGPATKGANATVLVTTTYASQAALNAGVTCNVANLGRIEYVTGINGCDGPPDRTGICRCENYDPVGAGADYAWREAWPVGEVWLQRNSGVAGGSYVAVGIQGAASAHTPPWYFEMFHDTADSCVQLEYLDGSNGNFATWGRLGLTEQMLLQLGYLSVDAVHAFWGMTNAPTGVVINPAAASFTAALQNFTDGWFYGWWAETTTIEAGSRRASANSVQTLMTLSSGTDRGFWLTAHMKGWIATASIIEMIQPLAAATWNARFMAKLGYPFTMARHPSLSPVSTNWVNGTSSTNPPSNATQLRPVVALCANSSPGPGAMLHFYKARMAVDVYDYD